MNWSYFQQKVDNFDLKAYRTLYAKAESRRRDFVRRFPVSRVRSMSLRDYAQGIGNHDDNFCYEIEWSLAELGKINGTNASKFGIYFSSKGHYHITKLWQRNTPEESMAALREELANLIEAGSKNDLDAIRRSPISPIFKGKILATYFPEKYLSVFSEAHLDYFIHCLNLDHEITTESDIFDKRNILVAFKNTNKRMQDWPLHAFAHFLYFEYPKSPKHGDENVEYFDYCVFSTGDFTSFDDLQTSHGKGKGDYEGQNKRNAELGQRGEYVVMSYERDKLREHNIANEPTQVSLYDDTCGYDIKSYDETGSQIYIEVKATNSSFKDFQFYFTANELAAARSLGGAYHIYVVSKPHSARPKIFDLGNPFLEEGKIKPIPVLYKLHIGKI